MYLRFLALMSLGMFGISLVLKTLLDRVFVDWDMVGDMRRHVGGIARKARYTQIYDYEQEFGRVRTRLAPVAKTPPPLALPPRIRITPLPAPRGPAPRPLPIPGFMAPVTTSRPYDGK